MVRSFYTVNDSFYRSLCRCKTSVPSRVESVSWRVFKQTRTAHHTEARSMDQLIPSLATLVEAFGECFHPQVFSTFQSLIAGWIVCLGPHTISGVWQATGLAARRHHDTAYAVFHSAAWEWDDLGIILATLTLT